MVRAGGSASRIIGDQGSTDAGGGVGSSRRRPPAWQLPVGRGLGPKWTPNNQVFPPLGGQSTTDRRPNEQKLLDRTEEVLGSGNRLVRSLRLSWIEVLGPPEVRSSKT